MAEEPLFDFTNDSGSDRIVRILREDIGDVGANNFQMAIADIEDIETGERFNGVARARLTARKSE